MVLNAKIGNGTKSSNQFARHFLILKRDDVLKFHGIFSWKNQEYGWLRKGQHGRQIDLGFLSD